MKSIFISVMLAVSVFVYSDLRAEVPDLDLGVLVVSPAGVTSGIEGLPFSSSVIEREEIEKDNIFSYNRILNSQPGIHVHRTGDFGRSDIAVRGLGDRGRKVMILVDGRPTKMGLFGCSITQTLPVDNIQRLDIVRGPASVLYGSDAMGGAVNIITRSDQKKGFGGEIRTSVGSFGKKQLRIMQSGGFERFGYVFTAGGSQTDGFRENSGYESADYSLRMRTEPGENSRMDLNVRYYSGTREEPAPEGEPSHLADEWQTYERGAVEMDYEMAAGRSLFGVKAYRNFGDHEFSGGYESEDYTNGLIFNAVSRVWGGNRIISGIEFRQQAGEFEDGPFGGEWKKNEYAFYLMYEQRFSDALSLFTGARYNIDEKTDNNISTQLGAVYNLSRRTTFRASRSEGFRSPQINDLYMYPASNKDLKPEKAVNYEVGLRHRIGQNIDIDLSAFRKTGEDIIQRSGDGPGIFKNEGEFEFRGAEAAVSAGLWDLSSVRVSYSYLDPGEHTMGRPGNKAGASLSFSPGDLYFDLGGEYVSSYYSKNEKKGKLDDYLTINLRANYRLFDNLKIFAEIDNLLDSSYSIYADLPGDSAGVYPMPGRNLAGGISYAF